MCGPKSITNIHQHTHTGTTRLYNPNIHTNEYREPKPETPIFSMMTVEAVPQVTAYIERLTTLHQLLSNSFMLVRLTSSYTTHINLKCRFAVKSEEVTTEVKLQAKSLEVEGSSHRDRLSLPSYFYK